MGGEALVELAKASPLLAAVVAGFVWGPNWLKVVLGHRRKMLKFRSEADKADKKIHNAIADRKRGQLKLPPPGSAVPRTPPKGGNKGRPSKAKN